MIYFHTKTTGELVRHRSCLLVLFSVNYPVITKDLCVRMRLVLDSVVVLLTNFPLDKVLEYGHIFRRPIIYITLDSKMTFDSIVCAVLWHWLSLKGAPEKSLLLIQFLCENSERSSCLCRCFTRTTHERWCPSGLLSFMSQFNLCHWAVYGDSPSSRVRIVHWYLLWHAAVWLGIFGRWFVTAWRFKWVPGFFLIVWTIV